MVRRVHFLQICCSRMASGGSDASSSIGMTGDVRNAPRICLDYRLQEFVLSGLSNTESGKAVEQACSGCSGVSSARLR